jgi:4'-phosphopantetheinyl transferase EntD
LGDSDEPLYPEEAAAMAPFAEKRRLEFASGRRCARKALAELGVDGFPLLSGSDRAPIWPSGIVGTITHTDGPPGGYCGVAVADRHLTCGLGIDAEPRLPLPTELWSRVLDEREQHEARATVEPGIRARLVFSAKETTYKALYPTFKQFLEFSDVHIEIGCDEAIFLASLVGEAARIAPSHLKLLGRLVIDEELIVTAMVLPSGDFPLAQEGLSLHHVPC